MIGEFGNEILFHLASNFHGFARRWCRHPRATLLDSLVAALGCILWGRDRSDQGLKPVKSPDMSGGP